MQTNKDATYTRLMNSAKWKYLRKHILTRYPLCQICLTNGEISVAEEIHHITPIQTGVSDADKERLAYDQKNLIALCHSCHVKEHRKLGKQSRDDREKRKQSILESFRKNFIE